MAPPSVYRTADSPPQPAPRSATTTPRDLAALGRSILRPARPRLPEARAVVDGVQRAAEAWELLAARGLVPMEWVGDFSRRIFGGGRRGRAPLTVADAVALASDAQGLVQAEALAHEVAARITPWVGSHQRRVLWKVLDPAVPNRAFRPSRFALGGAVEREVDMAGFLDGRVSTEELIGVLQAFFGARPDGPLRRWEEVVHAAAITPWRDAVMYAAEDALRERAWARSCERWQRAPKTRSTWPTASLALETREVRFALLPDPFEPLVSLWYTGYALHYINDQVIALVAPSPTA